MTRFRAPIQFTVLWLAIAIGLVSVVAWSQSLASDKEQAQLVAFAQQRHAEATATRLAASMRLAFALGDADLAREIAAEAVQLDPPLHGLVVRMAGRPEFAVGDLVADGLRARATVEHFTARGDMLLFGDWPLQQIPGTGEPLGEIEVSTRDPALLAARDTLAPPSRWLLYVSLLATVAFMVASGLFVRVRLLRLAKVAIDVATGQFERAHERAQRIAGDDEFAWVGHQIHDIREFTREQVERVQDRNASLLRDVTLQDERLARMSRLTATLVAPMGSAPTLVPVLTALVEEADATSGVLLDRGDDGSWHCIAATGVTTPLEEIDAESLATTLLNHDSQATGVYELPALAANHPWLQITERRTALAGVVRIPLVFGESSLGWICLAARNRFSADDLEFFRDAAPPLAIALASRRAYAESLSLAAALELRNTELVAQRDELQIVDKLRQEFVANISHELRTPLNAITCYAELMSDGMYGEINREQANALSGIEQAGAHLLELVNQVLDLSRMDAGGISLNLEECDLRDILRETIVIASPLCRDRPYVPAFVGTKHRLTTDAERVYQIVTNLLNNAIKFTPTGSVTVQLQPLADGGAQIDVIDTGIGISPENLELIFEEFRQVDGSSTRAHDGVGLGLAISRRLAAALGGSLSVVSTIGEGSTFTLCLPAKPPVAEADNSATAAVEAANHGHAPRVAS